MTHGRLLLVDTASLYFRAFYALPTSLRAPDGSPANAVRGLADFLATFLERTQATHVACAWDVDWRPQWRVDLVPNYKRHRLAVSDGGDVSPVASVDIAPREIGPVRLVEDVSEETPDELSPQVPRIMAMLEAAGISVLGAEESEADDVIAHVAATSSIPVAVLTGDRDLLQLVDDDRDVQVWYTGASLAKTKGWDEAAVLAAHGVSSAAYADYSLLRGDPSDGLPGVAGIGAKTAASLLTVYGSVAAALDAARDDSSDMAAGPRRKLLAAQEYVGRASVVVRPRPGLSWVEDLAQTRARAVRADWAAQADAWGLGGAGARLAAALGAAAARSTGEA